MPVRILAACALFIAFVSTATAATITSPPIWVDPSTQTLRCLFTNLDTRKERLVNRHVVDSLGDINFDAGATLSPGATLTVHFPSAFGVVRCVLTGKLSRKKTAITACALTGGVSHSCVSTGP